MLADRSVGAAQTHQAIDYLCEGIEVEQNRPDVARKNQPEVDRRFALAIRRAEGWVIASARARSDDPRFVSRDAGQ
jgi:hypothetical protein